MTSAVGAVIPLDDPMIGYAPVSTSRQLSQAIDVVAWLAEEAHKVAGKGAKELAMSQVLGATFEYMVEYLRHVSIDHDEPHDALVKAAAGPTEPTTAQLDFLRRVSKTRGKPLSAVPRGLRGAA